MTLSLPGRGVRSSLGALRSPATVVQQFTTSATPSSDPNDTQENKDAADPKFLDRVVGQLNGSIKKHPAETLAVLFASDIGSIGAMYGLLTLSGTQPFRPCSLPSACVWRTIFFLFRGVFIVFCVDFVCARNRNGILAGVCIGVCCESSISSLPLAVGFSCRGCDLQGFSRILSRSFDGSGWRITKVRIL